MTGAADVLVLGQVAVLLCWASLVGTICCNITHPSLSPWAVLASAFPVLPFMGARYVRSKRGWDVGVGAVVGERMVTVVSDVAPVGDCTT